MSQTHSFTSPPSSVRFSPEPSRSRRRGLLAGFLLLGLPLAALDLPPLGQALKQLLPADKAYQTTLKIDGSQAKALGGGYRAGETFTVFYTKDPSGTVTGKALELKEILVKYGVLHRWVVGLKADGDLKGVAVTKLGDPHAYPVADGRFQAQFAGKPLAEVVLGSGIDAMTGATDSSQLLVESVARAGKILGWADCR